MSIDVNHPWTVQHRIALVDSAYPQVPYALALVVNDDLDALVNGFTVTEEEALIIGSYIEYLVRDACDDAEYEKFMLSRVDICEDFDTVVLVKDCYGYWSYRQRSWEYGRFEPSPLFGKMSLIDVLDIIETSQRTGWTKDSWEQWKARHSLMT